MNETVISWTVPNWITVFLMVSLGSIIVGLGVKAFTSAKRKASGDD